MATGEPGRLRVLLDIERAALRRIWARAGAVALGLFTVEVGALALATAIARLRLAFHHGSFSALGVALGATGLGVDLCLVFGWFGLGLAVAAVSRPLSGRALFLPAARTSAGAVVIYGVCFFITYATAVGMLAILPSLAAGGDGTSSSAARLALALTPSLVLHLVLGASALAGIALVGRGVSPGRALATGIDHVLRRPAQAVPLFVFHAALAAGLTAGVVLALGASRACLVAVAPIAALSLLLAVAAFDAALARDARLATG